MLRQLFIRVMSTVYPQNKLETKLTAPPGDIPTRALNVLWFLHDEKVIRCTSGRDGASMMISGASINTLVSG